MRFSSPRPTSSFRILAFAPLLVWLAACTEPRPIAQTETESGPTCTGCHGVAGAEHAAPPPALWRDPGEPDAHSLHVEASTWHAAIECEQCHRVPETVLDPGHVDTPLPAEVTWGELPRADGADPSFDSATRTCSGVYCHGSTLAAADGALLRPQWQGHAEGDPATACTSCHGSPPGGRHPPRTDCALCHAPVIDAAGDFVDPSLHVNGRVDLSELTCSSCHGDATSPAPPQSLAGATATSDPAVGAHRAHLADSAWHAPITCGACHRVPAALGDAGHLDSEYPAEVVWGPVATADGAAPSYDRSGLSCSGVYCHGASLTDGQGTSTEPVWTVVDGSQAACGTCHGNPPGGSHPRRGDCATCHDTVIDAAGSFIAPELHVNGSVDGDVYACDSCHGEDGNRAPPVNVDGDSSPGARGVGAHAAHTRASSWHAPVACSACHVVPADVDQPGHRDGSLPAEVVFSGLATSNAATPAFAAGTCAGVYCHGATLAGAANPSPAWMPGQGQPVVCGSCHGLPATPDHVNDTACDRCHGEVIGPDGGFINSHLHIDGVVEAVPCTECHGDAPATGAHFVHTVQLGYRCAECHYGHQHNEAGLSPGDDFAGTYQRAAVDIVFDPNGINTDANNGFHLGAPTFERGATREESRCLNLACHNPDNAFTGKGRDTEAAHEAWTANAPSWGAALTDCKDCHLDSLPPWNTTDWEGWLRPDWDAGSHANHADRPYGPAIDDCRDCHNAVDVTDAAASHPRHANGVVDTDQAGDYPILVHSERAFLTVVSPYVDGEPGTVVGGTCTDVYCHGGSSQMTFRGANELVLSWGIDSIGCDDCHLSDWSDHWLGADQRSHRIHCDPYADFVAYGPGDGGLHDVCMHCHSSRWWVGPSGWLEDYTVTHFNGRIDFLATSGEQPPTTPDGASPVTFAETRVCDRCHGGPANGDAVKALWWQNNDASPTRLACLSCHGAADLANSMGDGSGGAAADIASTWAATGHGAASIDDPATTTADGIIDQVAPVACVACHDPDASHVRENDPWATKTNPFRLVAAADHGTSGGADRFCAGRCHAAAPPADHTYNVADEEPAGAGEHPTSTMLVPDASQKLPANGQMPFERILSDGTAVAAGTDILVCVTCHDPHGIDSTEVVDRRFGGAHPTPASARMLRFDQGPAPTAPPDCTACPPDCGSCAPLCGECHQ